MTLLGQTQPVAAEGGFARLLRDWRQKRRMSQLDLALSSGVSQRHVSFLESGRANPSRNMILQLCETLEIPLRDRNALLSAAGFAALFKERALNDPQMGQVMSAMRMMLKAHEPFPAIVLDRIWNIVLSNGPFDAVMTMLGDDIWERVGDGQPNLMRLFFHPHGLAPYIANWSTAGPLLWQRAMRESDDLGGAEMKALLNSLRPLQHSHILWSQAQTAFMPVMAFDLNINGLVLSMFGIIATFGTAQDVTADELRIETLFPADAQTEALFRGMDAGSPS